MNRKFDTGVKSPTDGEGMRGVYAPVLISAIAVVVTAAIFISAPSIDLLVSSWFYKQDLGFYLGRTVTVVLMRNIGIWITVATIVGLIALAIWWHLRPDAMERWHSDRPRADWWFITLGMLLGPGMLVNLIFKPIWGRARPVHVTEFGGKDRFTAAWEIAGQCKWNCSFISGEAAASSFVLAFCFVVPPAWRMKAFLFGVAVTAVVSYARIAAGGHFLSDVVTAWAMMALMIFILRAQVFHGALLGPMKSWFGTTKSGRGN